MAVRDLTSSFAGYRLEQVLSVDTVSTTYRARAEQRVSLRGRPVALRVTDPLRTDDGPDRKAISDFLQAISHAVAVEHPALTGILDAGEADGRAYVATRLVAGPTLDAYLHHHGPLAPADAVALLRPVAEALDLAHDRGVLHGALSPRTLLVDQQGRRGGTPSAVLTGFGLEHVLSRDVRNDPTGVDLLDLCYVAPEQLGGGAIDGRADQYALACALYHCVAGRPPFVRDTVAALFGAHLFSEARVPAGRGAGTPLAAAVTSGMAKDPAERQESCVALVTLAAEAGSAGGVGSGSAEGLDGPVPAPASGAAQSRGGAGVRLRDTSAPSLSEQAAGRRARRRARRRLPIPWPAAAMLVLAGIICTLVLAAVLGGDEPGAGGPAAGRQVASGMLPEGMGGQGDGVPAAVEWQGQVQEQPVSALAVAGDVVVSVSPRRLTAVTAAAGEPRWDSDVVTGELSEVAVAGGVVAARGSGLRALSAADGALRWSKDDVLTPLGALAAADDSFYSVRRGRVATELVAYAAGTGERRWSFSAADVTGDGSGGGAGAAELSEEAAVVATDGHLAVLSDDRLFSVDTAAARDGAAGARWAVEVGEPWPGAVAVAGAAVVVGGEDGEVCAYGSVEGDRLWCEEIVGASEHAPEIVINGSAVVVVMPNQASQLALASGELEWVYDPPQPLVPMAVVQGTQVVVADIAGNLHGLDTVHRYEAWQAVGLGEVTALAAGDDAVFAGTGDGGVVRIRPGGAVTS